jgi:hypothetical protein
LPLCFCGSSFSAAPHRHLISAEKVMAVLTIIIINIITLIIIM